MAIDTIKSTAVLDGAIATADIADDAVTADKLANSINTSIAVGAAALPKSGGTMTGTIADFRSTGIDDNSNALAMTIDVNENVGIGVTPVSGWYGNATALQIAATGSIFNTSNWEDFHIANNVYLNSSGTESYIQADGASQIRLTDVGLMDFKVAASGSADAAISWTTAMTINSASKVMIRSDGTTAEGWNFNPNGFLQHCAPAGSVRSMTGFYNGGNVVGEIRTSASATAYLTSSDYRLKENVTPMSGATAQTKLLKPCNFDWIRGGNVNGFLAHELAEVVPEAVSGTKDAMRDEEYEVTAATETEAAVMGTRSVPDMQGIDQSKLVPLLVKTIQELEARITALEDA